MIALWIILGVAALLIIFGISAYNAIIRLQNKAEEASSGIDVHLNKRYDLVPNLVETVKGYATHEKEALERVVSARYAAMQAKGFSEKEKAEGDFSRAIGSLFALGESYPDLKANANFLSLQEQLTEIETEIQNARKYYNAVARTFNDKIMAFPSNIIANMMKKTKLEYFTLSDEKKGERVEVKF